MNKDLGPLIRPTAGEEVVLVLQGGWGGEYVGRTKDLPRSHSWSWQSGEGTQAGLQSPGAFQCVMFST